MKERDEILHWLYWAQSATASKGRDPFPVRRLIEAFRAINEGRSDPLFVPAKAQNSSKTSSDQHIETLAVLSIGALVKTGISKADALVAVRSIAGPTITIDLVKKISSKGSNKYKGHKLHYSVLRNRVTLNLVDRGLPPFGPKTILDNLSLAVLLTKGRLNNE